MSSDSTNKAIIAAIKANQDSALQSFYVEMHRRGIPLMRTWGVPEDRHEDLLQEGMMTLFVNVKTGKYQPQKEAHISTYLFQICKYKWYAERRLKVQSNTHYLDQEEVNRVADEVDYTQDDVTDDRITRLMKGLDHLGEKCKHILMAFYWRRWSMEDIAQDAGITVASAKNAKYRCMMRLRQTLGAIDE